MVILQAGVILPMLVTTAFVGTLWAMVKTIGTVLGAVVACLTASRVFSLTGSDAELVKAE